MWKQADLQAQPVVIAELGVNHNGQEAQALRLVDAACDACAHAVKLQVFRPQTLLSRQAELAAYQQDTAASAADLLQNLTLHFASLCRIVAHARNQKLAVIATPFSVTDISTLSELHLDAVKIASPDAVNPLLLDAAQTLGLPLIISTGACTLEECKLPAQRLLDHRPGGALLHCVSSYPTPADHATLAGIPALASLLSERATPLQAQDLKRVAVGYSDHTVEIDTGALAVAAGARVLEKHLTLGRDQIGPDHAASLEPQDFKAYVQQVLRADHMLGPPGKRVLAPERDVRRVARQSVVALKSLPAGHRLTTADLGTARPGTGLPAARLDRVLDAVLAQPITQGELLTKAHVREDSSAAFADLDKP